MDGRDPTPPFETHTRTSISGSVLSKTHKISLLLLVPIHAGWLSLFQKTRWLGVREEAGTRLSEKTDRPDQPLLPVSLSFFLHSHSFFSRSRSHIPVVCLQDLTSTLIWSSVVDDLAVDCTTNATSGPGSQIRNRIGFNATSPCFSAVFGLFPLTTVVNSLRHAAFAYPTRRGMGARSICPVATICRQSATLVRRVEYRQTLRQGLWLLRPTLLSRGPRLRCQCPR